MKELSIEEKAKAYDEVIERAKEQLEGAKVFDYKEGQIAHDIRTTTYAIFPELKESEDERIRKAQLDYWRSVGGKEWHGVPVQETIAWLEKQGEQKPNPCDGCINRKGCINCENGELRETAQKPTDKVEPKFHEGDWVVCEITGSVYQIKNCIENLNNHRYGYDLTNGGYIGSNEVNHYHLWTIADAKDGDVLACENGWTCIFKKLVNDETFSSYCFMDNTKWFCETGSECHTLKEEFVKVYNGKIYPATKEQRELLFAKMKESGYEWDAKKKELREIVNPSEPDLVGMKELGKVWDEKQDPILQRLDRIYDLLLHKLNEKIIINNPFPRLTETPYKPGEVWCGSSAATSEKGGEE